MTTIQFNRKIPEFNERFSLNIFLFHDTNLKGDCNLKKKLFTQMTN